MLTYGPHLHVSVNCLVLNQRQLLPLTCCTASTFRSLLLLDVGYNRQDVDTLPTSAACVTKLSGAGPTSTCVADLFCTVLTFLQPAPPQPAQGRRPHPPDVRAAQCGLPLPNVLGGEWGTNVAEYRQHLLCVVWLC